MMGDASIVSVVPISPTSTGQTPVFTHCETASLHSGGGSVRETNSPPVVVTTACADAREWNRAAPPLVLRTMTVSLNVPGATDMARIVISPSAQASPWENEKRSVFGIA